MAGYDEKRARLVDTINALATAAWQEYMHNPYQRLYLVGRLVATPDGNIWDDLQIGNDSTELPYVRAEHLPRNVTVQGMYDCLYDALRREPLMIFYS